MICKIQNVCDDSKCHLSQVENIFSKLPVITTPVSGPEVGRGEGVVLAGAGVATGPTSLKHLCLHSVGSVNLFWLPPQPENQNGRQSLMDSSK